MTKPTILVATDGSASGSAALEAALELAASDGDAVVVLTVWRHPRGSFEPRDELGPELEAVERDLARGVLETALAEARLVDVPTEGLIREGNLAAEICAAAVELQPRLLVVGSHGFGPLVEATLGSVSADVLREAAVPVLVVPVTAATAAPR
jgi:nucleotide-binding universal stress UspA family protein